MLPAGIVQKTIDELSTLLEPGDILVDGGNSYYRDDIVRAKALAAKQISYVDCGTSGGVWGLERGYCLMIGGEESPVRHLDPIFKTIAPGRSQCRAHAVTGPQRWHGARRLPALRAERGGAFREDGPQRHRVRDDGRDRRGSRHHRPCRCRAAST